MAPRRSVGTVITFAVAVLTIAFAGFANLWVAPRLVGVSTPEAYRAFETTGLVSIVVFAVIWVVLAAGITWAAVARLHWSAAWLRTERHRFISLAGCCLIAYGGIAASSWLSYVQVALAAEHVLRWEEWERGAIALPVAVWVSGLVATAAALVLGAAGMAYDRIAGKAALVPVQA